MPNFRFLLHDNIYYEMSGVVIETQKSGSLRFILLNGQIIYFHGDAAKSVQTFLSLPSWPNLPVIDTGYINKYIAEANNPNQSNHIDNSGPPGALLTTGLMSLVAPQSPLTVTLPPVSHPGFPLGYGSFTGNGDDLSHSNVSGPINTDKSRAGVNAIHAVPGSPKLNIVAIRKAAGIHGEEK